MLPLPTPPNHQKTSLNILLLATGARYRKLAREEDGQYADAIYRLNEKKGKKKRLEVVIQLN